MEGLKDTVSFALAALKAITISNGAGVLALLAFSGQIVGSESSYAAVSIDALSTPMTLFAFGTAWGIIATAVSYLAQVCFTEITRKDKKASRWGIAFRYAAVIFSIAGILFFVCGIIESSCAFNDIAKSPHSTQQ